MDAVITAITTPVKNMFLQSLLCQILAYATPNVQNQTSETFEKVIWKARQKATMCVQSCTKTCKLVSRETAKTNEIQA